MGHCIRFGRRLESEVHELIDDKFASDKALVDRRHAIAGGLMLGLAGLTWLREPSEAVAPLARDVLNDLVPNVIDKWSFSNKNGLVLPTEDKLSDSLYSHVVTRVYKSFTQLPIMLLVAYSNTQNGMLQLHRPELCYPANGFQISQTVIDYFRTDYSLELPIRRFSAAGFQRSEQVLYWTRIGDEHPTSWAEQRLAVMRANLNAVIPDGILVRISTAAPDYAAAKSDLEQFTKAFLRSSSPQLRKLMIGRS